MTMKAIFDVHYSKGNTNTGVVIFEHWDDNSAKFEFTIAGITSEEYISGQFYKLELPCILNAIRTIEVNLETIIIDGYVWLDTNKKGLGSYLYDALECKIPIIGVAKNFFLSTSSSIKLIRGKSKKPLFISTQGIDQIEAAESIKCMHGEFRIPYLIKRADQLSRTI